MHPLWKGNIEDRVKLLESNVLNYCLKITRADLRKIDHKMREWRFKELSSYSGWAMSLTPTPYPTSYFPPPQESTPLPSHNFKGNFKASTWWLKKFKNRRGIRNQSIHWEKLSAAEETVELFLQKLRQVMAEKGVTAEQIYNADETGLLWKCLPDRNLVSCHEKSAAGFKKSKDRLCNCPWLYQCHRHK